MSIVRKNPKFVDGFIDRFGGPRFYFRRKGGPRTALPGLPWSPEFMAAYEAALRGEVADRISIHRVIAGSIEELILDYKQCDAWLNGLSDGSRKFRKSILEQFRARYGALKVRGCERSHIQTIIANLKPSAQSNWVKTLRGLFKFAVDDNRITLDPTQGISKKQAPKTGGFRPWAEADVSAFREHYAIGSRERLAMELMLNLGIRVSDACLIGPRDIRNGVLADYQPFKGRKTGGLQINVPVHADLAQVIAGTKVIGTRRFLVAPRGGDYNNDYLSQSMREWCDAAGLPACTSHGLRKLCLTRLAEAGCSAFEIMAISGHKNLKEVMTYVEAANRKKLAVSAMGKLVGHSS